MHSSVTATSTVLVVWSRSSFTQAHPALRDGVRDVPGPSFQVFRRSSKTGFQGKHSPSVSMEREDKHFLNAPPSIIQLLVYIRLDCVPVTILRQQNILTIG